MPHESAVVLDGPPPYTPREAAHLIFVFNLFYAQFLHGLALTGSPITQRPPTRHTEEGQGAACLQAQRKKTNPMPAKVQHFKTAFLLYQGQLEAPRSCAAEPPAVALPMNTAIAKLICGYKHSNTCVDR